MAHRLTVLSLWPDLLSRLCEFRWKRVEGNIHNLALEISLSHAHFCPYRKTRIIECDQEIKFSDIR